MRRVNRPLSSALLLATLSATPLAAQEPVPSKPDVGQGLQRERARLANYQWRLKTEMKVDGVIRLSKVEDVHLGPDGGLVKRIVRFDKAPEPTPFAENDPRSRVYAPLPGSEEERLFEIAQDLMQYYLRLSPERVAEWAKRAEILPSDADHPGLVRMHGRGLGRPARRRGALPRPEDAERRAHRGQDDRRSRASSTSLSSAPRSRSSTGAARTRRPSGSRSASS